MSIAFDCPFCRHAFTVPDELAGKKAKCKHCGTTMQVPGGARPSPAAEKAPPAPATRPTPRPKTAAVKPADIYGLDEDDMARPAPAGSLYDDELEAVGRAPAPRRAGGDGEPKPRRPRASRAEPSEGALQARKIGFGLMGLGLLSFVLPFVGLQIKGLHRMTPEHQMAGGIALVVLGGLIVGLTYLFGTPGVLKRLAIGIAAIGGGFVALSVLVALVRGPRAGGNPQNLAGPPNPAAPPGFAAAGPPAGFDTRPPWEREPQSDIRVSLSNGKLMNRTAGFGGRMPGLDIEVDYRVTGGTLAPGEKLTLVIQSKTGRGELDNLFRMNFESSGTIGASSFSATPEDGPYTAWLEVGHFAAGPQGARRRKVSDDVGLSFVNAPAPENPGEGFHIPQQGEGPGGPPPGFPGPPPGFPGPPPGFGGRRP